MQVSLDIFESIVPENELIMEIDVRIDRGSRYSFAYTKVEGKKKIEKFLKTVQFFSGKHGGYIRLFLDVVPDICYSIKKK